MLFSAILLIILAMIFLRLYNRSHGGERKEISLHDAMRAILGFTAVMIGWYAIYNLPLLFGLTGEGSTTDFAIRLGAAVVVILLGAVIRQAVGLVLMMSGLLAVLPSLGFLYDSLGNFGILLVIAIVLAVLIGATVYFHGKQPQEIHRG